MLTDLEETSEPIESLKEIVLCAFLKGQPKNPKLRNITKELLSRIDSANSIKTVVQSPRGSPSKSLFGFPKGSPSFEASTSMAKTPSKTQSKLQQSFTNVSLESPKINKRSIIMDVRNPNHPNQSPLVSVADRNLQKQ